MESNSHPKESYRSLLTSSKTHKTKNRTTSTIIFQILTRNATPYQPKRPKTTTKPQDYWQRQVKTINIQLKQLTTEPDYTPQTHNHSDNDEHPQESYYELMRDAPDKYFSDNTQISSVPTDKSPEIHHQTYHTYQCQPSLTLKRKRHMYYMPMDFEKLTLYGLIDAGALTSAISEQDLNKIKLIANEAKKDTGPPTNFQIMVANGQLEVPIGTVLLEFEVADFMLRENFIIMKNLPNPLIGLCFLRRNNAVFDVTQGTLTFPYLSLQLKPDKQVP